MPTVLDRLRSSAGLSTPTQTTAAPKGGRKSVASRITEYQTARLRADLGQWRNALSWAENLYYPDRTELLRLYREAVLDSHLSSVIETRKLNLLSSRACFRRRGSTSFAWKPWKPAFGGRASWSYYRRLMGSLRAWK
jgi:hypothetical protein